MVVKGTYTCSNESVNDPRTHFIYIFIHEYKKKIIEYLSSQILRVTQQLIALNEDHVLYRF